MRERDWTTRAGLRALCLVVLCRGRRSHRCGYVEVPEGHPLFGVGYNEPTMTIPYDVIEGMKLGKRSPLLGFSASVGAFPDEELRRSPDVAFDCHGGLTFSGAGQDGYPVTSNGWWFGFDCMHVDNGEIEPPYRGRMYEEDGVVRTEEYVVEECERLASQITEMFPLEEKHGETEEQA